MIHVDTKQLGRFERVGDRITGHRRLGCSRGAGYEKANVAIDGARRLNPVKELPDEKQATKVGFLLRAVAWFNGQGISCRRMLSDNGSAYCSRPWREACSTLGLTPKPTRPYTPRTNGKAEQFIKTLLAEWTYWMAFQTSSERNHRLQRYLAIYNGSRYHMSLAGRNPFQQLGLLRATK